MEKETVLQYLDNLIIHTIESPINTFKPLPEMDKIKTDLELLRSKIQCPLKVAVIGEVKAGKSTLINAFAGGEVAPTNVTEATACIMNIEYSTIRSGYILYKDKTKFEASIEEIYNVLKENENDQDFFKKVEIVKLSLPLPGLREINLIDTPGLATITQSNDATTKEYYQNIDVILWVLNGNYIGQMEVNSEVREVAKLGKPIIAVINKIDEVNGDPEDLVDYVDDSLGIYLKDIKTISALNAFKALQKNDNCELQRSGFTDLYNYLIEKIERNSDDVKLESIFTSAKAIEAKLRFVHIEAEKELKTILDGYYDIEANLSSIRTSVNDRIKVQAQNWLNTEFLAVAEKQLLAIESMEQLKNNMEKVINDYSFDELKTYCGQAQRALLDQWQEEIGFVNLRITKQIENNALVRNNNYSMIMSTMPEQNKKNSVSFIDSMLVAGAAGGTAVATMVATAPAYVSLGSAISITVGTFMPPALLAGAAVYGIKKYLSGKNEDKAKKSLVHAVISQIRHERGQILLDGIEQYGNKLYYMAVEQSKDDFINKNLSGKPITDMEMFLSNLRQYNKSYDEKM